MDVSAQIFHAKVMHKRLSPKVNQFTYRVWYLALPLARLAEVPLARNRFGWVSFYDADHGAKDGSALLPWAEEVLREHGLAQQVAEVMLIAMPRLGGYVFNPVSFWLCLDVQGQLRAVICEVNNTFGETHRYICAHHDQRPLAADDWMEAAKVFHVSPFLPREGYYRFRFALAGSKLGIWIDYYDAQGDKQLLTALSGELCPLTLAALRQVCWRYPLVTIKTIVLIHWQAVKLFVRGIRYINKPPQLAPSVSVVRNLNQSNGVKP